MFGAEAMGVPPPALRKDDQGHPIHEPRYESVPEGGPALYPVFERHRDAILTVLERSSCAFDPCWRQIDYRCSRESVARIGQIR